MPMHGDPKFFPGTQLWAATGAGQMWPAVVMEYHEYDARAVRRMGTGEDICISFYHNPLTAVPINSHDAAMSTVLDFNHSLADRADVDFQLAVGHAKWDRERAARRRLDAAANIQRPWLNGNSYEMGAMQPVLRPTTDSAPGANSQIDQTVDLDEDGFQVYDPMMFGPPVVPARHNSQPSPPTRIESSTSRHIAQMVVRSPPPLASGANSGTVPTSTTTTAPEGVTVKTVLLEHPRADKFKEVINNVIEVVSAKYQKKDVLKRFLKSDLYDAKTRTINFKGENLDEIFNYGLTPLSKFFYSDRKFELTYKCGVPQTEVEVLREQASALNSKLKTAESSLREAEASTGGNGQCCICLDAAAEYVMVPCRHLCLCSGDCKEHLSKASGRDKKCPVCRVPITDMLRVFTS